MDAADVIRLLDLEPHPEGGHYRETWRDVPAGGGRGSGTSIYFLLEARQRSHWHRVDADELWHFYGGDPLRLSLASSGNGPVRDRVLGIDLGMGIEPQAMVPAGWWQAAESLGRWTLVGCTVTPAFDFSGFDLAPEGWSPG
jgi:predicted cupin superfamily sugar epimerase